MLRLYGIRDTLIKKVGGLDKTLDAAAIEPLSLKAICDHLSVRRLRLQRVGDLYFAILAGWCVLQDYEYIGRQDVSPDDGEGGWSIPRRRLFHHVLDPDMFIVQLLAADDAVSAHVLDRDIFRRDNAATIFFIDAHHLCHDTGWFH